MSIPILKAGNAKPVKTKESIEKSDKEASVVTVEGRYIDLKGEDPNRFVPNGMTLIGSSLNPSGDGFGVLTVRCQKFETSSSFSPVRTTFSIDMNEVQYDLEDHPSLSDVRDDILKWLATDEAKRVSDGNYKYMDEDGELQDVSNEAEKFCKAYMAGIKTFCRFFPVVEKISVYKNPPGMSMSGASFTGGSPDFSNGIGRYDAPPISLNGFPPTNWYKSKDSWRQSENKTWTRTEQWTYTPESSSGTHAWIYNDL